MNGRLLIQQEAHEKTVKELREKSKNISLLDVASAGEISRLQATIKELEARCTLQHIEILGSRDAHSQIQSARAANSLLEADLRAQHDKIRELETSA